MKTRDMPPREYLHECFEYRDGKLFWKIRPDWHFKTVRAMRIWRARFAGKRAGKKDRYGYILISIKGMRFSEHRIIWAMYRGITTLSIDHIDRDASNNRIENLREATQSENNSNARMRINNTSGVKGVHKNNSGKWQAQIQHNNKLEYIGVFVTIEEAAAAYRRRGKELFGEFFHAG